MNAKILVSGFGGQGVLFTGKFLAYIGLLAGHEVSWLPSYGPEMRGGTARCGVILSDSPIGSPIVDKPDVLIAMNLPSLDLLEDNVVPGGHILLDSALIPRSVRRTDVTAHPLPIGTMTRELDLESLGNMILAGAALKVLGLTDEALLESAMKKTVPERKQNLCEANMRAIHVGIKY